MKNFSIFFKLLITLFIYFGKLVPALSQTIITPNEFKGTDIERIQQAIDSANRSSHSVTIPHENANGTYLWKIDRAILVPSNMTILLNNCTIQLSDSCRDNMFRSNNVGQGMTHPIWNNNIAILGTGNVRLKGANNPRATGDGLRTLTLNNKKGRFSYGSDAGKPGRKQTSDWRNIMILMAYVDGFQLKNVTIEYAHSWAVTCEHVHHATISQIQLYVPQFRKVNGQLMNTFNNDGIDLREGCKYFQINTITGINGDDLIALSALDLGSAYHSNGNINSYQVTSTRHEGPKDDIEYIHITDCKTNYTGVAIRASDSASIHHVYINDIITNARPNIKTPYQGSPYVLLLGNQGYGRPTIRGKIHDIYAMNLIGDGKNLILINAPIKDCAFMNGIYTGTEAPSAITYHVNKSLSEHITEVNLVKCKSAKDRKEM